VKDCEKGTPILRFMSAGLSCWCMASMSCLGRHKLAFDLSGVSFPPTLHSAIRVLGREFYLITLYMTEPTKTCSRLSSPFSPNDLGNAVGALETVC